MIRIVWSLRVGVVWCGVCVYYTQMNCVSNPCEKLRPICTSKLIFAYKLHVTTIHDACFRDAFT